MTKFRTGVVIGFAAGYYLGAKAGRDRYEQLRCAAGALRRSKTLDHAATAVGRAKAVVDLGRERVHDAVEPTGEPLPAATYIAR
ncbi:MAG: hypothetical protein NVS3B21_17680 [Acidimicrobiales bacterium]